MFYKIDNRVPSLAVIMLIGEHVQKTIEALTDDVLAVLRDHFGIPGEVIASTRSELFGQPERASVPLPFTGIIYQQRCKAVRVNHGLFTQCQNRLTDGVYCGTCIKHVKNGEPEHGNIHGRLAEAWVSPAGRTPVPYPHVLGKLGISPEVARHQAQQLGVDIESHLFETAKAKRGRPARVKKKLQKAVGNLIIKRLLEMAGSEPDSMAQALDREFCQS